MLPVAMIDTEKIQPPGRKRPKLGIRVGMKIGKPLDFSRYEGMEGDRFVLRSITDEIMYELMELSGQEYVDIYAQVAKDRLKAEKAEAGEAERPRECSADARRVRRPPGAADRARCLTACAIETAVWRGAGGVPRPRPGLRRRRSTCGATTSTATPPAAGSCSAVMAVLDRGHASPTAGPPVGAGRC